MLSVYLEFCSPFTDNSVKQVRYEFRDLEKYTTLANEAQQKFNKSIDEIADAIRCERYFNAFMSIVNLAHQDGIAPERHNCTRLEECTHQFKETVLP